MHFMQMTSFTSPTARFVCQVQDQFKNRFDIKTGEVSVYLGRIVVESDQFKTSINQSEYIEEILRKFDMGSSHAVGTPMTGRLSASEKGKDLSAPENAAFLPMQSIAVSLKEVRTTPDFRFVGTCQDSYVLVSSHLDGPRSLPVSQVFDLLHYTMDPSLAAVHVSLCDSYSLLSADLGPDLRLIPKTCSQALSPDFITDWKPYASRPMVVLS